MFLGAIGGQSCHLCAVWPVDFGPGPEFSVLFWVLGFGFFGIFRVFLRALF